MPKFESQNKIIADGPHYLDAWLRGEVIAQASGSKSAAKLEKMPTRQLIYYAVARRLAATLEHALQNSLHYSRKLAENPGAEAVKQGIAELDRISALCLDGTSRSHGLIELAVDKVLNSLPFTWPDELAREPEAFLAVSHSEVEGLISQRSSGTTAAAGGAALTEPGDEGFKRVFCTKEDLEGSIAFFAHGMHYLLSPESGGRVALLMSAGGRGGGNLAGLYSEAMRRIGVPCLVPGDASDEAATLEQLEEFLPTCIVGTPRRVISLFRQGAGQDARIGRIKERLERVLLSGDRISSAVRAMLERELGAASYLHYGMVESGLGTAVECGCRAGCHYREADFFIEIITGDGVSHPRPQPMREAVYMDPDDLDGGRVFGPTPWGEITITSLSRRGTPLIRYRTGDSGRIIVDSCPCGSALWRLETRGRMSDYAELPSAPGSGSFAPQLVHSAFDCSLYPLPWLKDYQALIHSGPEGKASEIGLSVLVSGKAPADAEAARALRQALAPLEARCAPHGVALRLRLIRPGESPAQSPKRIFMHSAAPFDPAIYAW